VRIVLDQSAVEAFLDGSTSVGEILAELTDEIAFAGIAVPTLAEISRTTSLNPSRITMFKFLLEHVTIEPLSVDADDLFRLLDLAKRLDSIDLAMALLLAESLDAFVLTARPTAYIGDDGEPLPDVIAIED
jgi:hypothetical protein